MSQLYMDAYANDHDETTILTATTTLDITCRCCPMSDVLVHVIYTGQPCHDADDGL